MRRIWLIGAALPGLLGGGSMPDQGRAAEAPEVVASILPIAGIAGAVMDGVGEPTLLLDPGASPHAYSMRPSEAQALAGADLILWVGEGLEGFLARPLQALSDDAQVIALAELPGLTLLPFREDALLDEHADDDGHAHAQDDDHTHDDDHDNAQGDSDPHIWLSPANARVIADAIAAALAEIDPGHAAAYTTNAGAFATRLDDVEVEIRAMLEPVRGRPFIVFHDAYRYFEAHFGVEASGAIHLSPEVQPGAAHIAAIQARIRELDAACVFAEPQFEPRIIETVTEGSAARSGVLDPLGGDLEPGPDAYGQLLLDLGGSMAACLGD